MYSAVMVQKNFQGRQEPLEEGHSGRLTEVDDNQCRTIAHADSLRTP